MLCKRDCTGCCDWKKKSLSPGIFLWRKSTPQIVFFSLWLVIFPYPQHPNTPHPFLPLLIFNISLSFSEAVPHCQPIPAYLWLQSGCAWLILLIRGWMPAAHIGRREEKGARGEGSENRGTRWKNWEMIGMTIAISVFEKSTWIFVLSLN